MTIHRREVLKGAVALSVVSAFPGAALAQAAFAPTPGAWRTFQIVTRLEVAQPEGKVQAWVPLPSVNEADWFRSFGSEWQTKAKSAELRQDAKYGARMLHLEWAGAESPVVEVT